MPSESARNHYVETAHKQGFVPVRIGVSGTDIDPLFASFREVLHDIYDQPSTHGQDLIDGLNVSVPDRPLDSVGFISQRRIGQVNPYERERAPSSDDKDIFHFTPQTVEHFTEYMRTRGGINTAMRGLLDQCVELHEAVKSSVRPVLGALGLSDYILSPRGYENKDVHHLRLIRYLATTATESPHFKAHDSLAQLHLDRSKFTAAVWESSSGLVGAPGNNIYGNPDLTLEEFDEAAQRALQTPIQHSSGQVKLFAGAGYNRLPGEVRRVSGDLDPLLHGVTDDNPGEERDAVVLFMNETSLHTDCSVPTPEETTFELIREQIAAKRAA